jgi:propanol-preferring alcohol dehydrogenase
VRAWIVEEQASIEAEPLRLAEVPTPHAGDGEVRVRIEACGVCRTDLHITEGDLPLHKCPIVPGHEIVGVVDELGPESDRFQVGERVGVYWLHSSCGQCKYCRSGRENYCPEIERTGWDVDGGFAEFITVPEAYAVPLGGVELDPAEIAPLLCPGMAGYAAFRLAELQEGDRLGLYGFGPTAFYVLKIAQSQGIEVYVSTRAQKNIESAREAGAAWAADAAKEPMPTRLDAAILFPPAGNLVEPVLAQLERAGVLVLAPVSMSPIRIERYSDHLWGRSVRTLYNLNRADAELFFELVPKLDLELPLSIFPFEEVQQALVQVRRGELEGANAVISVS